MTSSINRSRSLNPTWLWLVSSTLLMCTTSVAQIRTDGSLGHSAQTLAGPNFLIPQSLGKLAGNNLFHSFQSFNLATGEVANFTTTSSNIANVISRVTGGDASHINGTLRLSAASGAPAFFFINPAGITFGAGASVDVPGAFHVSTANDIRFADGRFYADLAQSSSFSTAAPEAFGFVGNTRATLAIKDGVLLKPHNTYSASLVAGDITLDGGGIGAAGGVIHAVAVGAMPVDIPISGQIPVVDGSLQIVNGGFISTVNLGAISARQILARAGSITLDSGGRMTSNSFLNESGGAGGIDVLAKNDLLMRNGSYIQSFSGSLAAGADIVINAKNIGLDTDAYVYSAALTDGGGNGAKISLTALESINVKNGANVSSYTDSIGHAGDIQLNAKNIAITNHASLYSISDTNGVGGTGNIRMDATNAIAMADHSRVYVSGSSSAGAGSLNLNASEVSLDTGSFLGSASLAGTSAAGTLNVNAGKSIKLSNGSTIVSTSVSSGDAGMIKLAANDITLDGKSYISTIVATGGSGNAGSIDVTARNSLFLFDGSLIDSSTFSNGQGGMIKVVAKDIVIDKDSAISSLAIGGTGNAGSIDILSSNRLVLSNNGKIISSTDTDGNGGSINITANNINVNSRGGMSAATFAHSGNGGDITINASGVVSINDGFLTSLTSGAGRAGSIRVDASGILLTGKNSFIDASASLLSSGQTGAITLKARDAISVNDGGKIFMVNSVSRLDSKKIRPSMLSLSAPNIYLNSAFISAESFGNLDAGNIVIDFSKQFYLSYSQVFTKAIADDIGGIAGNGGGISVKGAGVVSLYGSKMNTSVSGITGNGGDISIKADALVLTTGFIQANTTAKNANGGLVNIDVNTLVASGNTLFVGGTEKTFDSRVFGFNVIQAAAPTGVNGVISIANPLLDLSSSLARLKVQLLDVTGLGRNPCQSTGGSSLAQSGRGGLPASYRSSLNAESEIDSMILQSGSAEKISSSSTYFLGLSKACL